MKSKLIILILLITTVVYQGSDASDDTVNKPPNVVFFLVDDLGWSDVGCFGSSFYDTPNIDQLAAEGVRFTDGYATCHVCSPTRASILTGKYPARMNLTDWIPGRGNNSFQVLANAKKVISLDKDETTIAEVLKGLGYETALFGKWHLGRDTDPTEHGFDVHVPHSVNSNLGRRGFLSPKDIPGLDGGEYVTDRLAELAAQYICLLYTSPSPRDLSTSRMPSSA